MSKALLYDATISLTWTGLAITAAIISPGFARCGLAAKYAPISRPRSSWRSNNRRPR